jgi:hypothetical protein
MNYEDNTKTIIICITVTFCVMIATFGGCTMHTDYRMAQAIRAGADPIKTACAFSLNADKQVCQAVVAK